MRGAGVMTRDEFVVPSEDPVKPSHLTLETAKVKQGMGTSHQRTHE